MNLSRKKTNAIQATEYGKGFGTDKQNLENIIEKKNETNKVTQDKRIAKCNYKLPSIILSNYLFLVLLITITTTNI